MLGLKKRDPHLESYPNKVAGLGDPSKFPLAWIRKPTFHPDPITPKPMGSTPLPKPLKPKTLKTNTRD